MSPRFILWLRVGVFLWLAPSAAATWAQEPLHEAIDRFVSAQSGGPMAARSGDAEFLRRVYLDLAGRIPAAAEAREFLAEQAVDKRARLIDRLLAGVGYPRRMRELFHAMLMERRGDDPLWDEFLRRSFEANKPWDVLSREILDPDAQDEATRGAAYFYTARLDKVGQQDTDYPGLTRDVGRLFLGVDLQCAQCHNHLFIEDYKQHDFQGLYAVYLNTFIRRDVLYPAIGENVMAKKTEFSSVFDKVPLATGPRVPGGDEIEIPTFAAGEEYRTPPDKATKHPGEPKFSPLEAIAARIATAENAAFRRNIANRLWFVMMGRGLVQPLDQFHRDNPPSHPELLERLAQEIAAQRFDLRSLLRELALSETYQRSGHFAGGGETPAPESYRVALEKPLSAEQLFWSTLVATGAADVVPLVASPSAIDAKQSGENANDSANNSAKPVDPVDELRKRLVAAFAGPAKEPEIEFSPSVKAALFMLNDPQALALFEPRSGNLVDRLAKLADPAAIAEELYLSVLTRQPTEEERADVIDALAKQPERRDAVLRYMAWSLVASTEFCLNH